MAGWFDELAKLVNKKADERDTALKAAAAAKKKKDDKTAKTMGDKAKEIDAEVGRLVAKIDAARQLDAKNTVAAIKELGF